MESIEIERVTLAHIEQLQQIGRQTFIETFSEINTEENMTKYLDESFNISRLTTEIQNMNSEFYFALIDAKVVGYLKINRGDAQTELKNDNTLELERIYVLNEFHGKKVGQVLFNKAFQIAEQSKVDYLWLGVWEENHKALKFYSKNGFTAFNKHMFVLGDSIQTDIMMKLQIS
ncbi:MAG: GNAT family N-acetyltransferase [Prolixibacteraceae bacterium]|nr:GNAT family N-acetyltransferase [Prolixibacteraceae bacterium]